MTTHKYFTSCMICGLVVKGFYFCLGGICWWGFFFFMGGCIYSVFTITRHCGFYMGSWLILHRKSFLHLRIYWNLLSANQELGIENIMVKEIGMVGPNLMELSVLQGRLMRQMQSSSLMKECTHKLRSGLRGKERCSVNVSHKEI